MYHYDVRMIRDVFPLDNKSLLCRYDGKKYVRGIRRVICNGGMRDYVTPVYEYENSTNGFLLAITTNHVLVNKEKNEFI